MITEQAIIGGGSVTHLSRAWTSEERATLGRDRKITPLRAMTRLRQYRERIELAGGVDAYYESGGCLGPFGSVKSAGRPKPMKRETLETIARSLRTTEQRLEATRYQLKMAAKQQAADGVSMAEIGRRVGLSRARVQQILTGGG